MKSLITASRTRPPACPVALFCFFAAIHLATANVVTSYLDDNVGNTLRNVIVATPANGIITFAAPIGGFPATITLDPAKGELFLAKNVTITGPGATSLMIVNTGGRVFHIGGNITAFISGLRMQGIVLAANGADGTMFSRDGVGGNDAQGGAILMDQKSNVHIDSCYFEQCQAIGGNGGNAFSPPFTSPAANGGKGGDAQGGAIANNGGNLFLTDCTFNMNSAIGGRGGMGFDSGQGGDGGKAFGGALADMYGGSDIYLVNCTFASNTVRGGNGGAGGNAVVATGGINGGNGGDGGDAIGGGIYFFDGCAACTGVDHNTISLNVCNPGNGGAGGTGPTAGAPGMNGSAHGGGIYFAGPGTPIDELPIRNSIIANNYDYPSTISGSGADVWGVFGSLGYNLIGNAEASSGWLATMFDKIGTFALPFDPKLEPLQFNGGTVMTMAPLSCSPAIDAAMTGILGLDEIGQLRPKVVTILGHVGDGSDIGAFELQSYPTGAPVTLTIAPTQTNGVIVIKWPSDSCYILEQTPDLQNPTWTIVTNERHFEAGFQEVFVNTGGNKMFFRLFHP